VEFALLRVFSLFGVLMPTREKIVISIIFHRIFFPQCVMDMCSMCGGRSRQELIYVWLVKLFMEI
jgi:hypothetical protein